MLFDDAVSVRAFSVMEDHALTYAVKNSHTIPQIIWAVNLVITNSEGLWGMYTLTLSLYHFQKTLNPLQ